MHHLDLMLITTDPILAKSAELSGVDRIFIDLEMQGKEKRQAGKGLFLSTHRLEDVAKLAQIVAPSRLMVRLNPLYPNSKEEIDSVLKSSIGTVMLPMFTRASEVETFVRLVDQRCRVSLLLENRDAIANIDEVVKVKGVDEIHIGLNDLALSLGLKNWFDIFPTSILDDLSSKIQKAGLRFGFGGITVPEKELSIPAEMVIGEQVRLASTSALLGRSFKKSLGTDFSLHRVQTQVQKLRKMIETWNLVSLEDRFKNYRRLVETIDLYYNY